MVSKKSIKLLIVAMIIFVLSSLLFFIMSISNEKQISKKTLKAETTIMSAPEQVSATDNIATGTNGTCSWLIDKDGKLIIWPTNDVSGVLQDITSNSGAPWYSYREQITEVKFEEGVKAGEKSCRALFNGCTNLISIDFADFDTSDAKDMFYMFYQCASLEELNLSGLNTENVENMYGIFNNTYNLKFLNLSNFDTTKATNITGICTNSLEKIIIGPKCNFKTNTNYGYPFGRGMWKRLEDGEIYSIQEICNNSLAGNAEGTYEKVSNISKEMSVDYPVQYKINPVSKVDSYTTTNSNIVVNEDSTVVVKDVPFTATEKYVVPGEITLQFNDVVSDYRSETMPDEYKNYDLLFKISNITLFDLTGGETEESGDLNILSINKYGGLSLNHLYTENKPNKSTHVEVKYDISMQIIDVDSGNRPQDGAYIFSAYDLDVPAIRDKDRGLAQNNINDSERGYGYYSEAINLIEGFDTNYIKMIDNTFLHRINSENIPLDIKNDYGIDEFVRIYGDRPDIGSEFSEFTVKGNVAEDTKFQWTMGGTGSTAILSYYQPKLVEIEKQNEDGEKLGGAKFELYYGDNTSPISTWTSSESNSESLFLCPGIYTLKEVEAPNGYSQADDIEFFIDTGNTIKVDGQEVEKVVMKNKIRDDLSYTVNYLEKGTNEILQTAKEVNNKTFGDVINAHDEVIEIDDYTYNSINCDTLTIGTDENVINIYYIKNSAEFNYTVEYYYDGIKDDSKTETNTSNYNSIINTYTDKNITGYKLEKTEGLPLVISDNEDENIIKVYYIPDESQTKTITYTVEYYKDDEKVDDDTQTVSIPVQVLENTIPVNKDEINTVDKYPGYVLEKTEPEEIPNTAEDGDVIKVKYVKRTDLSYTVNYLEKGTEPLKVLETPKKVDNLTYGTVINSEDEKIEIPGYDYDSISCDTLTIGTGENVINIYYTKKDAKLIIEYREKRSNEPLIENKEENGKMFDQYDLNDYIETIEGYTLVEKPEPLDVTLEHEIETRTFYYLKNTKVIVNYIDRETGEKLDNDEINGKSGDNVTVYAKDFDNYVLVEKPENENIEMTDDVITVNYYYAKISAGVTEKHIDLKTNELLDTKTYEGNEGDPYTTSEKDIEGYDLVEEKYPENANGKMKVEPIEVKYYYIRKAKVIVEHIDENTNEKILERVKQDDNTYIEKISTENIDGHEGDLYTTKEKTFEKYKLSKVPENKSGKMEIKKNADGTFDVVTYVRYYYIREAEKVIEKHIDIYTGKEIEDENIYEGYEGDPYNTSKKEIEGYDLIAVPENAEGTMTDKEIDVKYYYVKKTVVNVKYIDKDTGKEITENVLINGHQNDPYKSEEKKVNGYDIVKEEYPKNESGKMTVEPITVTYYYKKISIPAENSPKNAGKDNNSSGSNSKTSGDVTTVIPSTVTPGTTVASSTTTSSKNNVVTASPSSSKTTTVNTTNSSDNSVKAGDNLPVISVGIIGIVILLNIIQNIVNYAKAKKE